MKTLAQQPSVRFAHKFIVYLLVFCIVNMPAWALDWNGGTNASFNGSDTVTVDALRSIGIWNNFDTAPGELIQFLQNGGGALTSNHAVLNKVIGADPTLFQGILEGGQGHIILFNSNGITIGGTAVINAGRFTATTMGLTMTDQEFLAGNSNFEFAKNGDPSAQIALLAGSEISADRVDLLAQKISNAGTITTGTGGVVVMAAGDRVLLGEAGSKVIVELDSVSLSDVPEIDGLGDIVNEGTINAPGGRIVMAAGDTFSRAIDGVDDLTIAVESGTGRVGQFGTLNTDALEGDGGSITLTAADTVVLGSDSITTANAGANGDGGDVVVYSPDTALFRDGALVEAKGGSESGNGGFFEISGKEYVETMGDIDLTGDRNGMFLIDPLDLWIVDGLTDDVAEGPDDVWKPVADTGGTVVSQLDVDDLESYLDVADVTLSTLGTPDADGQHGDIIFDFGGKGGSAHGPLKSGSDPKNPSDSSLIVMADRNIEFKDDSSIDFEGAGNVELYASTQGDSPDYDGAVIAPKDTLNIQTGAGDITIEAGSGGIDMGALQIGVENTTGEEAHLRLFTINGNEEPVVYGYNYNPDGTFASDKSTDFDINVQHLDAEGRRLASVFVDSAGDLKILGRPNLGGAALAETNTVRTGGDPAQSYICLIADGDVYVEDFLFAEANSSSQSYAGVWVGAGTNTQYEPGDSRYYEGTATVLSSPKAIQADAKSNADPEIAVEDATIRVYASNVNIEGAVEALTPAGTYKKNDPTAADSGFFTSFDPTSEDHLAYDPDEKDSQEDVRNAKYDKVILGSRALIDIDVSKDGSCLNCANEISVIFVLVDDLDTINWRSGYTIEGFDFPATMLDVLANDTLPDNVTISSITIIPDGTSKGSVVLVGDELQYIPPSYDDDTVFEWDGVSQYATFEDTFNYQVEITTEEGDTYLSEGSALVTITVQNEVPTLAPDSETIHMDDTADFDLTTFIDKDPDNPQVPPVGTLIIDPDGSPGATIGTYGDSVALGDVTVPVSDGTLVNPDGDTLEGPDVDGIVEYTPLEGYVTGSKDPISIDYTVEDSSIVYAEVADDYDEQDPDAPVVQSETLSVTVENTLPGGDVVLEDAPMDAQNVDLDVTGGAGFSDAEDDFEIVSINPATNDNNYGFGGELEYNGTNDPAYVPGGDYTYSADAALPGYVGEDDFVATLWDGQRTYYADGSSAVLLTDTGVGTIDLETVNKRPEGDVWLGTTPMGELIDDGGLAGGTAFTDDGIGNPITVIGDGTISDQDYNIVFGGTLTNNDDGTFDYDPDGGPMSLPGYTGDSDDDFTVYGGTELGISENADDRFNVDLWDGEMAYTFTEGGEIQTAIPVYGEGTVSVDITNETPGGDAWFGVVHMDSEDNPHGWTLVNPSDPTSGVIPVGAPDFGDADVVDGTYYSWFGLNGTLTYDSATDTWSYTTPDIDHDSGTKDGYVGIYGDGADIPVNPGYLPDDIFTVQLSNGEVEYQFGGLDPDGSGTEWTQRGEYYEGENKFPTPVWARDVTGTGTVTADIYNLKPTGDGTLGSHPLGTITVTADQVGVRDGIPLDVEDLLGIAQRGVGTDADILTILDIVIAIDGSAGGKLEYQGGQWTYTPAPGFVGTETFDVPLWDGEYEYYFFDYGLGTMGEKIEGFPSNESEYSLMRGAPQLGAGTLTVTITPPPPTPTPTPVTPVPVAPVAPLADYEAPKLVGCPVELDAAASELAVNSDQLQLLIANALATNPNLQPCEACQNLLAAASTLQSINQDQLAAMNQIFNSLAPIDAPFTPEVSTSVTTEFANFMNMEPQLAEMSADELDQYQQYVLADAVVEAFVNYVAILENDLRLPVGDSVALVMDKYGDQIEASGNPNIAAYVLDRMTPAETETEVEL